MAAPPWHRTISGQTRMDRAGPGCPWTVPGDPRVKPGGVPPRSNSGAGPVWSGSPVLMEPSRVPSRNRQSLAPKVQPGRPDSVGWTCRSGPPFQDPAQVWGHASDFPVSHARALRPLKMHPDYNPGDHVWSRTGREAESPDQVRGHAPYPPAPALTGVGVSRCGQPPSVLMSTRMPGPIVELSDARFK
jgi:hypothetical protein